MAVETCTYIRLQKFDYMYQRICIYNSIMLFFIGDISRTFIVHDCFDYPWCFTDCIDQFLIEWPFLQLLILPINEYMKVSIGGSTLQFVFSVFKKVSLSCTSLVRFISNILIKFFAYNLF